MPPVLFATALSLVTLHVGIHQQAGTVHDIATDGAAGQCSMSPARVSCPVGPGGEVTFRWGPGGDWEVSGTTTLTPELDQGVAWVLAPQVDRLEEHAALAMELATPGTVSDLFIRTGDNEPEVPSIWMYWALFALKDHPEPLLRRSLVEALFPLVRDTASDPFPPEAPELMPPGLISQLATDSDPSVRRKTCALLREVRRGALAAEAEQAYNTLLTDKDRSIRRVCLAAMAQAPREDVMPAEETWRIALRHLPEPKGPGRAAAATLAKLAPVFGGGDLPPSVDPVQAVRLTLQHHPEKAWAVWRAWRQQVPYDPEWVDLLLRDTVGLSKPLLDHWALSDPEPLATALQRWEPRPPHSSRYELIQSFLADAQNPVLREVLDRD